VLVVGGLILPRLVNIDSFRPKIESELTSTLGRQVKVGKLSLSIFSGSVTADNISIADDAAFSKEPFVTAKSFQAGVEVMPLIFSKTLHITGITLEEPQIRLLRGTGGMWNFSSIGKSSAPPAEPGAKSGDGTTQALTVDEIKVEKGRLLVGVANSPDKPEVYGNVSLEVKGYSATSRFPFELTALLPGGGDFSLKGRCGPINAGDASTTPLEASITIKKLDLAASGFVAAGSGIQGVADFEGALNSNGKQAKTSGTIKLENWKLAAKGAPSKRAVEVKYAVEQDLKAEVGTLTQCDVAIGKAVARLTGTYQTQGQSTAINMKVNGSNMPVDELEAALPAVGVVLPSGSKLQGGTLSADLAIAGATSGLTTSGPIRLSNAKLAGFDVGGKMAAIPGLGGKQSGGKDTTIQNCSATVRVAPDSTQVSAINVTIPPLGVVTGGGTISSGGALNFEMNADLSGGAGGAVLRKAGGGQGNGVPFSIEGTTADPKFVPNVKAMAGSVVKGKVAGVIPASPVSKKFGRRK
jgi:AsmA protein